MIKSFCVRTWRCIGRKFVITPLNNIQRAVFRWNAVSGHFVWIKIAPCTHFGLESTCSVMFLAKGESNCWIPACIFLHSKKNYWPPRLCAFEKGDNTVRCVDIILISVRKLEMTINHFSFLVAYSGRCFSCLVISVHASQTFKNLFFHSPRLWLLFTTWMCSTSKEQFSVELNNFTFHFNLGSNNSNTTLIRLCWSGYNQHWSVQTSTGVISNQLKT